MTTVELNTLAEFAAELAALKSRVTVGRKGRV